jgi:ankyrin repeat protein
MNKTLLSLLFACSLSFSSAHAALPDPAAFSVTLELGDVKQARGWLDEGLDPNFEGQLIGTGLMIGAWEGNIPLMELFLARGADIHRANRFGETALMLAAWKNQKAALRWLIAQGAQPNRPEREWTALHYATFAGHAGLIEDLLKAGADVNARSTNGSTVVMMAAREGHMALAKRLLEAGANPAITNDFEDDAVAWAMRHGNFDIARSFTSAENFAELSRRASQLRVQRSIPVPDSIDENLRLARLAEVRGNRREAITAFRRAFAELKMQEAPKKVGPGTTAKKATEARAPTGVVIRAKRGDPAQQSLAVTYAAPAGSPVETMDIDTLLEQARRAESSGNRKTALKLFRLAADRLKSVPP